MREWDTTDLSKNPVVNVSYVAEGECGPGNHGWYLEHRDGRMIGPWPTVEAALGQPEAANLKNRVSRF